MDPQKLVSLLSIIFFIVIWIFIFFIIRGIWRAFKRFLFELIDHIKGAGTGAYGASKKDYTREARDACERTTPKKDKYATPPWEE